MKIAPVHPFPARMAPDVAVSQLSTLNFDSLVVDPMMGSGTVLRHAVQLGHCAIGFDLDPMAVLMSRVWSTPVSEKNLGIVESVLWDVLPDVDPDEHLPWIDDDPETSNFVEFWFGEKQRRDLRRVAFCIAELGLQATEDLQPAVDVLKVALSRIIITKYNGASLAWDVSHSRPHRVMSTSEYDVLGGLQRSIGEVKRRLVATPLNARAKACEGDARKLSMLADATVDMVLTSPPYLNAIDYMRGHRLSLVWLGYSIPELRPIRKTSIGAERGPDHQISSTARSVQAAMVEASSLSRAHSAMIDRYSADLYSSLAEVRRILKPCGKAIFVIGNSCLRQTFIRNSEGVSKAASLCGLELISEVERDLPSKSRYLPTPGDKASSLGKRMRTESVLTFRVAA